MERNEVMSRPEHFLSLIREHKRGRLKLYLGFAPGVGKTFEMLQEAHRLKKQGVDVVVGIVETHGRQETIALCEGLEQLPRRRVSYRGVTLEELDADAVLARRPTVVLVDELAHTNAPESRHAKRYQDVEEFLKNGIHVMSTLNIQHLESLYDIVESFTHVKVKERVPDYVLEMADQIVNVDVSSEDLLERMRQGKIYPADRIERAMSHFFTDSNLTRLRELALEELATALDTRRHKREGRESALASERIMVCVSSRSPVVHRLLRKGARLAARFHAPWFAIYFQTPQERLELIDAATQRRVADSLALAQQLGGISMPYASTTFEAAVSAFVQEYGITHVVMGRSRRPWFRRWFGQSPLDRLLRAVPQVDVVVVSLGEEDK